MRELYADLRRYVGFGPEDEARLAALLPRLRPAFPQVAETFYAEILAHPDAARALERSDRPVSALKLTLTAWLTQLFEGPWDEAYVESRARIGRAHVRIALPQHYMVTATHVVRRELERAIRRTELPDAPAAMLSLSRALDIDLALMLHTYRHDLESRQARAERLATYGQLVGSIGHELRNPLGVIETSLYLLRERSDADAEALKHLDRIGQQVALANDIITQLLDLMRETPLLARPVDLARLVQEVSQGLGRPEGVALETLGLEAPVQVLGDATELHQVVRNLIDNAIHAAFPTGRVRVGVTRAGARLTFSVEDSGPGIDAAVMARLFEPLVTTKSKGIGLGLALVRRIVERHGGTVEAGRSEALGGARLTVTLPGAPS